MTYRTPAWDTLGIEPTEDRRAIRVAYARRLKEIDVDADPQAFIALREALESAQWEAERAELDRQFAVQNAELEDEYENGAPETVDPDDIAAELAFQRQALPYRALPAAPDRLVAPEDPRWAVAEPAPEALDAPVDAAGNEDRWQEPETVADPEPIGHLAPHPSEDRWEARDPDPEPDAPEPLPPRQDPWSQPPSVDVDAHVQALLRLLHELQSSETEPPGEWRAQMLEHWRVIGGDPRLQEIGHYADAESWWSDVIARTIPWSDPLVRPAIDLFGWREHEDFVTQLPAATHIVRRLHSLEFYHAVQQRKHPLNAAWRELVKPAQEGSWRGWVNSVQVRELLATVREHYPDLEDCFDWYRVGIWEGRVTSPGGGYSWSGKSEGGGFPAWAWIIVVVVIIRLLGSVGGMDKSSNTVPPIAVEAPRTGELHDQPRDLGFVLTMTGGSDLDWTRVQQVNPELANTLKSNWTIARDNNERLLTFTTRMRKLLLERYAAALVQADHAAIAEYRRIMLEEARLLKRRSSVDCDKYFRGELTSITDLPPAIRDRERALIARVLLDSTAADPRKSDGKFSIPTLLGEKAARRAGLTEEQFYAALNNRGTATNRCAGRIALIETALELPPAQGLTILREM